MLEVLSAWQTVALIRMPLSSLLLLQSNLIWMPNIQYLEGLNLGLTTDMDLYISLLTHTPSRVIDGFDTLDALEKVPVDEKNRPIQDVKIKTVMIHANPIADQR